MARFWQSDGIMHILWTLIVGLVVGVLAKLITPGRAPGDIIVTILLGLAGAFVARPLGHLVGVYRNDSIGPGIVASVIGAVILLAVYHAVARRRAV